MAVFGLFETQTLSLKKKTLRTFLYLCTENFKITIIHSPLCSDSKHMNFRSCYKYSIALRSSTCKIYSVVLHLFTLFYIITSERETLFIILHTVMQL